MKKMMKKNKRENRKPKFNASLVALVFTVLLILFFVMAYMLFHSRSIASLEELETLPDDAKILVIDSGTAKQISKANAKFGGSVTVFNVVEGRK